MLPLPSEPRLERQASAQFFHFQLSVGLETGWVTIVGGAHGWVWKDLLGGTYNAPRSGLCEGCSDKTGGGGGV